MEAAVTGGDIVADHGAASVLFGVYLVWPDKVSILETAAVSDPNTNGPCTTNHLPQTSRPH